MSRGRDVKQFQTLRVHSPIWRQFKAYTQRHHLTVSEGLATLLKCARRQQQGDLRFARNQVWKHQQEATTK